MRYATPSDVCTLLNISDRRLRDWGSIGAWPRLRKEDVDGVPQPQPEAVRNATYLYGLPEDQQDVEVTEPDFTTLRQVFYDKDLRSFVLPKVEFGASRVRPKKGRLPPLFLDIKDVVNLDEFLENTPVVAEVDGEDIGTIPQPQPTSARTPVVPLEEEEGHDIVEDTNDVPYVILNGKYVFNLPSKPRSPWVVDTADVERLVAAYSRDGDNATLNQLAREMGWHRKTVQETLKALGKTHDSLPFTDEQIAAADEDSLVEDLVRRKEEKVHVRAEREHWQKTKVLADKARTMEHFLKQVFSSAPIPAAPPAPPRYAGIVLPKKREISVILQATDLHHGKSGWKLQTGEESNRQTCRDKLMSASANLQAEIAHFGTVDKVILGVGGDWFHIDNPDGRTTKGTPQDHDGTFLRIFIEGCALARDHIEQWRGFGRQVILRGVRGNHDYYTSAMCLHWLAATYANASDVVVDSEFAKDRTYMECANTLIGFTHGESVKDAKLVPLMASEAPELWARCKYKVWHTGHWHTMKTDEQFGVVIEHNPSLASADDWHVRNGYVGNRQLLQAHILDHVRGPMAKVWVGP